MTSRKFELFLIRPNHFVMRLGVMPNVTPFPPLSDVIHE